MYKEDIIKSLTEFYQLIEKGIADINRRASKRDLANKRVTGDTDPKRDFTIFGGAGLVLQDILNETQDIDILTNSASLSQVDAILRNQEILSPFGENWGMADVKFEYNKVHYNLVGDNNIALSRSLDERIQLPYIIPVFVRPAEISLKDYEKIIADFKEGKQIAHPEKVSLYGSRVKEIRQRLDKHQ
jgi:hypothetical protein